MGMIRLFQYMAGQLDMAKEVYPTRSYPTAGLLAQTRRQAAGPGDERGAPEGIAVGNPDEITAQLKKWEAAGIDQVNFLLQAAEIIPQQQVLDSLRLFAEEVMPHFADDGAETRSGDVAQPVAGG
jgi:alkanesulfonate monooxygenase SsuD/methylene tetrahydromethanopterin reductase-like flavin-dependent oxidoreductase (luciferase family)